MNAKKSGHKRRARTREQIEAERRQLWERTQAEIDAIVEHFHEVLPQSEATSIGAIYARYTTRYQHSIADQVRSLFEAAVAQGIFVPRECVFVDLAVKGYRDRRPGFDALRAALAGKQIQVLLIFTTNRLYRKQYKALRFIDEEVVERGIRCMFVKNRLDTADGDRWRLPLQIHTAIDEHGTSMYADNVRAAHQGLLGRRAVHGTLALGYRGEPVEGERTKRGLPRCLIMIDEETKEWVVKIFQWYVVDLLSIDQIARRLNADPNAPPPPTAETGMWSHQTVLRLLKNPRYRGCWEYGRMQLRYVSDKDYVRQVPRAESLQQEQFEELRIISDKVWYAAAARIAERALTRGRKPKDRDCHRRPRLLDGIFFCPEHEQMLYSAGGYGESMACRVCRATAKEVRPLYSQLNRQLALDMTCGRLAELVRGDADIVLQVITACQSEAAAAQQPDVGQLPKWKSHVNHLTRSIEFNRTNPGGTDEEQEETARVIKRLQTERTETTAKIKKVEAARERQIRVPTKKEVVDLLDNLADILAEGANAATDTQRAATRQIIDLLTGGQILLHQQGERRAQRGWLQGKFSVALLDVLIEQASGAAPSLEHPKIEVTIDYRKPKPSASMADRAFELYGQSKLCAEIAKELKCSRSRVTKLLKDAHAERGLEMPDGRSRRSTLKVQHTEPPLYQQLADPAKALWDQELLIQEIAEKLEYDRTTVTSAIRHWHESRGLKVPDGRSRRETLARKVSVPGTDQARREPDEQSAA